MKRLYQVIAFYGNSRQYSLSFASLSEAKRELTRRITKETRPNWTYKLADFYGNLLS